MACAALALALFLYAALWYHNPLLAALCPGSALVTHRLFFDACQDLRINIPYHGAHFGVAALVASVAVLLGAPARRGGSALLTAWGFCALAVAWVAASWILAGRASWVALVGLASSLAAAVMLMAARDAIRHRMRKPGAPRQ